MPRIGRQSRQRTHVQQSLTEFITACRASPTSSVGQPEFEWDAPEWPGARWAKVAVGKRRRFGDDEALDADFIDFARAYFMTIRIEHGKGAAQAIQALKCVEAALLTVTGSGSLSGLSWPVLDEAAVVARKYFRKNTRYHVGRSIELLAKFVSEKRLVATNVSTWKAPLTRVCSVRRIGADGEAESNRKLPSLSGLQAMAEIFANDLVDPPARFVSAVWALLMCAPWRIGELLRLHVGAEYEESDDQGVVSYGLRYYGSKGFEHDIKIVPKVMEPVAREAFRRITEMTDSARRLARHLETHRKGPFLYPDCPRVKIDAELSLEEKGRYLRRRVPKGADFIENWRFRSICEHWERARAALPSGFPVFDEQTGLKWSEALFCVHRNFLHETRPTDWYRLLKPTANLVNDLLGARGQPIGVAAKLGYREPDGSLIRLKTHQARHYVCTLAERGSMAQEDLAKWAGRATLKDNRVYNHMGESERVEQARGVLEGTELAGRSGGLEVNEPTTRAEFNLRAVGPTHSTEFGACEHDWAMTPCIAHADCLNCAEHVYFKGDEEVYARLQARCRDHFVECEKALAAIRTGAGVADRWLEHALQSLVRELALVEALGSEDVKHGEMVRLTDASAQHSHLRRALEQRLPELSERSMFCEIKSMIARYINGEALVGIAGTADRRNSGRLEERHENHVGRPGQADSFGHGDLDDETDRSTT